MSSSKRHRCAKPARTERGVRRHVCRLAQRFARGNRVRSEALVRQPTSKYRRGIFVTMSRTKRTPLTTAGLFAGIGGIELGLSKCGYHTELMCEIDPGAARVLNHRFGVDVQPDIRMLGPLPKVDVVAAGFPCQDLSQAGRTAGIIGQQSRLVREVFRRLRHRSSGPRWLVLENVPFMLQLQRGKAMRYLVDQLETLGFTWAYRVVDTRSFGIPQRRRRVLLVASREDDPRAVLFGNDAGEEVKSFTGDEMCGFYWTEGLRGLGWAIDALPTLKGGSTLGIPSSPAIWDPMDGSITTPDIRDAERLQGFSAGWTEPAVDAAGTRKGHRWKLVGNAVSVPVAQWLGECLVSPANSSPSGTRLTSGVAWPQAAWGFKGTVHSVEVSQYPVKRRTPSLRDFLRFPRAPLSHRASSGFLARAGVSCLNFERAFLRDVERHARRMERPLAA
jgi:DNA (cytosine-5)-methyltransferase 1